jgi:hypothetical protein
MFRDKLERCRYCIYMCRDMGRRQILNILEKQHKGVDIKYTCLETKKGGVDIAFTCVEIWTEGRF